MHATSWAEQALSAVVLEPGLALDEVRTRLGAGLRLGDVGQRILAFYLVEMEERGLHQASGHSSTAQFAEDELDLDRRRTGELLRLGRKLLELPAIDRAFCAGRIGWSKVLLLMRVAAPEHEQAWLDRAVELACRDLALEVRLSKEGAAPRKAGDHKGLPEVRFRVSASLDVLAWQKLELAKQKLSAELGRPVGDAELLQEAAEVLLQMEQDGSVPGRKRVDASLYRIVLRGDGESLLADTELGPVPIDGSEDDDVLSRVRSACVRCDGECVGHGEEGRQDVPTPAALRRRVLARDGGRCRCCGSRRRLMVHHIRYRSKGGRTKASNLITLCTLCHALVHADLLVLRGRKAARIQFHDAEGRRLGAGEKRVPPAELGALIEVRAPAPRAERSAPERPAPQEMPAPQERDVAFAGLVGQEDLLARLDLAARGSLARGCSFPHTLFVGPPGTGKTTLARAIAARCGARLAETAGPLLQDVPALLTLLRGLEAGDMMFLDEVHAVPRPVLETLYQAMAEGRVGSLELPAFTVLAATTQDGDLPQALRSRFGLLEDLGYYATEDLAALVSRVAAEQGAGAERSAALHLAASARGTPREALRLLERVLDHVVTSGATAIDRAAVDVTLARLGYDADGLRPSEQRYLAVLRESRSPVPLHRLARMLGASARTLIEHLEPHLFLRGLVGMTPRGRVAVPCPQLVEA